jgi:hypothetical protein
VCGEDLVDVKHDVYSAQVPEGAGLKVHAGLITININNNIECLNAPLVVQGRTLRIGVSHPSQ